jgi:hypothetical protein
MRQVQFGMELAAELRKVQTSDFINGDNDNNDELQLLKTSLKAQLSHSDGIRGFMVAYLTGPGDDNDDRTNPPAILLEAIRDQLMVGDTSSMVSLMCMNVIMPMAMATMHRDPEKSASSKQTAVRGTALLRAVRGDCPTIIDNLNAILQVATTASGEIQATSPEEEQLVTFWAGFFDKWGYEGRQKEDIAKAVTELLLP